MLHNELSNNVKYFGALTYAVQLNTSGHDDDLWELFRGNLLHLTSISRTYASDPSANSSLLVIIKKLMSNLALIFFKANDRQPEESFNRWDNPIETFINLFSSPELSSDKIDGLLADMLVASVNYQNLIQFVESSEALNLLILLFSEVIVEDLTKAQSQKLNLSHLHKVVHQNLYISAMSVINHNLEKMLFTYDQNSSRPTLTENVFRCVNAWISYTSISRNLSEGRMDLSETFELLIRLMCTYKPPQSFPYSSTVVAIFGDIFANDPTLLNYELRSSVEGLFLGVSQNSTSVSGGHEWMLQYMNYLVTNEIYEDLKDLALCVVDFLQVSNLNVCNKLFTSVPNSDQRNLQQYVKVLLQMTNFSLTPVLEEFFSVRMVDFWLDLCDGYSNLVPETLKPETPELAADIFGQVIQIYLPKISLSNKQKILQNDEEDSLIHEFDDFRVAVLDLAESAWSVLGNDKLTDKLIASIGEINPSSGVDLFQVEALSYLLQKLLSDMTLSECPWMCDTLGSSSFFLPNILLLIKTGCQQENSNGSKEAHILSTDFVKTGTSLIGTISAFLKQDSQKLGECVNTLFQCLESCTNPSANDSKVELLVTKCISEVCEMCRQELTSYLPTFTKVHRAMLQRNSHVSNFTRQKFTRALGYIIQSFINDGPEPQAQFLSQIIDVIADGINEANSDRDHVLCLLTCFSELGSAMVQPGEPDDLLYLSQLSVFLNFWTQDPLQLRSKTSNLLEHVMSQYGKDPEFIEVGCLIMGKSLSLPEEKPHFLKFQMQEIMDFMVRRSSNCEPTTGLPYIAYHLEKVVNQYKSTLTPQDFDFMLSEFFLGQHGPAVAADPDLSQLMVNFINSVMDTRPGLAIHCEHWTTFIMPELLKLLPSKERFTISAVTKFWTKVVNNKKFTRNDEITIREQVSSVGLQLTQQTMYSLFHTQRSDLNFYSDLLRALVARYPLPFKQWLMQVLPQLCDNQPAHHLLIEKLFITRGSRAAANAVLEWWLDCNGLPHVSQ